MASPVIDQVELSTSSKNISHNSSYSENDNSDADGDAYRVELKKLNEQYYVSPGDTEDEDDIRAYRNALEKLNKSHSYYVIRRDKAFRRKRRNLKQQLQTNYEVYIPLKSDTDYSDYSDFLTYKEEVKLLNERYYVSPGDTEDSDYVASYRRELRNINKQHPYYVYKRNKIFKEEQVLAEEQMRTNYQVYISPESDDDDDADDEDSD